MLNREDIDLQKFNDAVFDGSYVVLYDVERGCWRKFHKIDGRQGYLRGTLLLDDPAGSKPPVELIETHEQRLRRR